MPRAGAVVQVDAAQRAPRGQEREPPSLALARFVGQLDVEVEVGKRLGAHVVREVAVGETERGDALVDGLRAAKGVVHGDAPVPEIEHSLGAAGTPIGWVGTHARHLAVQETVEPPHGVEQRGEDFPPHAVGPGGPVVQYQRREPIQRLPQGDTARTRVQDVIRGGGELLTELLPHETAAVGPRHRTPEAVAVGPGAIEVQIAVVGVAELVVDEVIVIPLPRVLEVLLPRLEADLSPRLVANHRVEGKGNQLGDHELAEGTQRAFARVAAETLQSIRTGSGLRTGRGLLGKYRSDGSDEGDEDQVAGAHAPQILVIEWTSLLH